MDTLPTELLTQILSHLPKETLPTTRLVSRAFSVMAFPLTFSHLTNWLDYEISHRSIISIAHDVHNRPAVMWSPWASEPDKPVDPVFMALVWKLLVRNDIPGGFPKVEEREEGEKSRGLNAMGCAVPIMLATIQGVKKVVEEKEQEEGEVRLTAKNFAILSSREEMTENRLKTGQNRFLLHRSYKGEARNEKKWGVF